MHDMHEKFRARQPQLTRPKLARITWWLPLSFAFAFACGSDTVPVYELECEDDAIGWELDIDGLVEPPPADFGVECASGWGHDVETRAASELVELPDAFQFIQAHPQGGLLLNPYGRESLWSDRLGVEVAQSSILWLDEQATEVHWLLDDLRYRAPIVVTTDTGTELWAWGRDDDDQLHLSRIEASTGAVLEQVAWPEDEPTSAVAAWPDEGGLWLKTRESISDDAEVHGLRRMASFAEAGPVLRTFEAPTVSFEDGSTGFAVVTLHPTPGGGLLWGSLGRLESVADDGGLRWALDEVQSFRVVDEHGGFLLGHFDDGEPDDQRQGLTLQRRSLDDASVLWTRVHHRYDFADEPGPDDWLIDTSLSYAARADGGYLVAGGHAYPAASCLQQPIIWAIDIDGEVEWAHRVEACGTLHIPDRRVDQRALVLGFSSANGDGSNGATEARWLQYFDL